MPKTTKTSNSAALIRDDHLFGSIGYTLNWVWVIVLISTHIMDGDSSQQIVFGEVALVWNPQGVFSDSIWPLCRLLFALGAVCVLMLFRIKRNTLKRQSKLQWVLYSVSPALITASHYLPIYCELIAWFLAGVGYCLAMVSWPLFFAGVNHKKIKPFLLLCIIEAVLICLCLLAFEDWLVPQAMLLVPLLSCIFFFIATSKLELGDEPVPSSPPISRSVIPLSSHLCVSASRTALFYLALVFCSRFDLDTATSYAVFTLATTALLCLTLYLDYRKYHVFDESIIIKMLLLVAVFLIIPSSFVVWLPFASVLSCIALAALLSSCVQSYTSLYGHIILYKLDPVRSFATDRIYSICGISLGSTIFAASYYFPVEQSFTPYTLLVAGILVAGTTLVGLKSNAPFEEKAVIASESRAMGFDTVEFSKKGWERCCIRFQRVYGLTEREREVLFPFSKGQTAEKIAKALFISTSTVRAHIYNIYHKADVHSRNELNEKIKKCREDE